MNRDWTLSPWSNCYAKFLLIESRNDGQVVNVVDRSDGRQIMQLRGKDAPSLNALDRPVKDEMPEVANE